MLEGKYLDFRFAAYRHVTIAQWLIIFSSMCIICHRVTQISFFSDETPRINLNHGNQPFIYEESLYSFLAPAIMVLSNPGPPIQPQNCHSGFSSLGLTWNSLSPLVTCYCKCGPGAGSSLGTANAQSPPQSCSVRICILYAEAWAPVFFPLSITLFILVSQPPHSWGPSSPLDFSTSHLVFLTLEAH